MQEVTERISSLGLSLFDAIHSQTSEDDRTTLLSIQSAVRSQHETYTYLEIGSYHGGSILPHLVDPQCTRIYSIDKRPDEQHDERGAAFGYEEGFTHIMMEKLSAVSPDDIGKVKTFDLDASDLNPEEIQDAPDYIFIDGEHTDVAVISDFNAVRPLIKGPCVVVFHDSHIVFHGLSKIIKTLKEEGTPFKAYSLPKFIFVIELNGFEAHKDPAILALLIDNYKSYLPSMDSMFKYREYFKKVSGMLYIKIYKRLYRVYYKTLRPLKKGIFR